GEGCGRDRQGGDGPGRIGDAVDLHVAHGVPVDAVEGALEGEGAGAGGGLEDFDGGGAAVTGEIAGGTVAIGGGSGLECDGQFVLGLLARGDSTNGHEEFLSGTGALGAKANPRAPVFGWQ